MLFVNVLVRKQSSTAICKIYYFEYVIYTRTRFVTAWHIEIVFNSSGKKVLFRNKKLHYTLYIVIVIFQLDGKICIVKIEKWIVFPELQYVNSNPACLEYF